MATKTTTHIAIISIPVFSHQSSVIEFCKRLIHLHHNFHITCIFPTIDAPIPATLSLLESLPSTIHCTFLPPINKQDLPQDAFIQNQLAVSQSMPSFHNWLSSLCLTSTMPPPIALVVDPFASQALEIAKEFNLLSLIYFPVSSITMSLLLHLPTLDEEISCEYKDYKEDIQIPGCCIPIHGKDLPSDFHDRSSLAYKSVLQHTKRLSLADGVLVNSFLEMHLQKEHNNYNSTPVYLVGPIIQTRGENSSSNGSEIEYCLKWLEEQRPNSVLYVSFGSLATISQQNVIELALGLELSGQKFLWVLRAPSDSVHVGHRTDSNEDDPLKFLPNGFLERTKEQGLIVPYWAPQKQILSHNSIGGFLTHCGWNSILESIMHGVPMIAWPLFAEQGMNAVLLTEGLKVALRIKFNENGIAEKEEIFKVVRDLIVLGEERSGIRERIKELKDAACGALAKDGSSTRALSQFGTLVKNSSMLPLKQ